MSFPRAVVVGRSGQVSSALAEALVGREILFTSSSGKDGALALDLGDAASIRSAFAEIWRRFGRGGVEVFLCGAMTHVDRCEQERERCRLVNAEGPRIVAEECRALGYGLTYFSTEYVFGGDEYQGGAVGPFRERDIPHPTSWYGECKLAAELAVQKILGEEGALVVRTTMVFSWDPAGMNFLMQYLRQMEAWKAGKAPAFRVPLDQISTPTYAPALAEATVRLRDAGRGGIFHVVGTDLLSRRELVERTAEAFAYPGAAAAFSFVRTAELGQAAKRPLSAGLDTAKARALGLPLLSLSEAFLDVSARRAGAPITG